MNRLVLGTLVFGVCWACTGDLLMAQAKPTGKLNGDLQRLQQESQPQLRRFAAPVANPGGLEVFRVPTVNGYVVIDAIAKESSKELLKDLKANGLINGSAYGRVVSGMMPVDKLGSLNSVSSLLSASPSLSKANAGLVTSQGDESLGSDMVRSMYGIDGSGVKVGALSDSYDCAGTGGGAAADVASGDLPPGVEVLLDIDGGCSDEGRAMMQLIHDVAPGSDQAFHTAFTGTAGFANGILALQAAGSKVIVDDVSYFAEPMFQDGIIAQAAQIVADNGSAYFSSAGNNARNSIESEYTPSSVPGVFGGPLHDWDAGPGEDPFLTFKLEGFGTTFIILNWDEPYASAGAAGANTDLDLWLFFEGSPIVASLDGNIGSDPIEIIGVNNSGPAGDVELAVEYFAGPGPNLLKIIHFGSDARFGEGAQEYETNSSSSYGHSNAANMAGVGAAAYFNTEAFNSFCMPACLNGFSSAGGTPILFDGDANPIYEVRDRPNFVGPDGGNTTFFGFDWEPDGWPNFFGTSASAPHVAAVAAMMLQTDSSLSPAEIYEILQDTAEDMNDPGFDFDTGHGYVRAAAAVDAVATDPRNPNKRFVCHIQGKKLKTLSVEAGSSVADHVGHGDKFGPCD